MKQCILFDLDGTLIDSMAFWMSLKFRLCENYSQRTGNTINLTAEDQKKIETLSLKGAIKYLNERYGVKINRQLDAIAPLKEFYENESLLLPFAKELLELLYSDGVKMCLVTATPEAAAKVALERHGLTKYFRFILTPEKVKGGKFHRPIFIIALQKLLCLPKNAVLIDDAAYAHKTAARLGIRRIGVNDPFRQDNLAPHCDIVCSSLSEIYEIYKRDNKL